MRRGTGNGKTMKQYTLIGLRRKRTRAAKDFMNTPCKTPGEKATAYAYNRWHQLCLDAGDKSPHVTFIDTDNCGDTTLPDLGLEKDFWDKWRKANS
jgi:hypothetical protein